MYSQEGMIDPMSEYTKKQNVVFKTALGVVEGGTLGAAFDTLRILTARHVYETFAAPIVFKRPDDAIEYSHNTSATQKVFLLGSVAIGAIIQGIRANKKAKTYNEKVDHWQNIVKHERGQPQEGKNSLNSTLHR